MDLFKRPHAKIGSDDGRVVRSSRWDAIHYDTPRYNIAPLLITLKSQEWASTLISLGVAGGGH